MKARKIIIVMSLLLMFTAPMIVFADEGKKIDGIYNIVKGKDFTFNGKEVEIIEFLNFYCGHCYHFEESIPVIKGNFPKKIKWKTVPLYWGKSVKAVEAFFLAEETGKGEEMKKALFKAIFIDKRDVNNINVVETIGAGIGLGFDFSRRLRAGEKAKDVGEAILMAQSYKVDSTPTLVIAGNLKVTTGAAGQGANAFRNNVITIVKSLFQKYK